MKQSELALIFTRIPLLAGLAPDDFRITPLAGYTNRNYRLQSSQQDWVLRIPRAATDGYIDRHAEAHNQQLAHDLELAPLPSWRDPHGTTLTVTLARSRNVIAADFASREMQQIIVAAMRRLHRSGCRFRGRVDLDQLLATHFERLDADQQNRFMPRLRQARRIVKLIATRDLEYVASHNDLVLENLLLDGARLWLIDWEYSAMASPYWDLATLCNAANLDLEQSQSVLQAYCAGAMQMEESLLFDYRGLLQLLSDCWMAALAND